MQKCPVCSSKRVISTSLSFKCKICGFSHKKSLNDIDFESYIDILKNEENSRN